MQHWKQAGSGSLDAGRYVMAGGRHRKAGRKTPAHPKALLSLKASANSPPKTMSFLGTQPRSTQVPPAPPASSDAMRANGSSQMAVLAPAHPMSMANFRLQAPHMQRSMLHDSLTIINGGGLSAVTDRSLTLKSASLARHRFQHRL